ncbi:hypothetical protein [Pseudomonas anguilliseptica]|uniref:Uncharacterized protein n=1 Tax=Pseudomonas anguilliseptica TaxID=53406 RepID=A0A1H5CK16_PSEAG|nr:hypothetical protein [Pseudomonas anguilliseptica]SED66680.1 hypothetical protein SAMN05421553_3076 [Pseudomonas anguilliseptica]
MLNHIQVDDLKRKSDGGKSLSDSEQDGITRYFIEHFYYTPVTYELIVKDDESKHQEQIRMFEQVIAGELGTTTRENELRSKVRLLVELYKSAGIFSGSEFDTSATISKESLKPFVAVCKKQKVKIERVLGVTLRNDYTGKPMQQLSQFLGMSGIKTLKQKSAKKNSQKVYQYKIDAVALGEIQEIVKRRKSKSSLP